MMPALLPRNTISSALGSYLPIQENSLLSNACVSRSISFCASFAFLSNEFKRPKADLISVRLSEVKYETSTSCSLLGVNATTASTKPFIWLFKVALTCGSPDKDSTTFTSTIRDVAVMPASNKRLASSP